MSAPLPSPASTRDAVTQASKPPSVRGRASKAAPGEEPLGAVHDATVSTRVVRGLAEAVEKVGGSSHELLRILKLGPQELRGQDARLPMSTIYALVEQAIAVTGDPALGLHWAERLGDGAFVPLSQLIIHSATLGQALESLEQFYPLLTDEPGFRVLPSSNYVLIRAAHLAGESAHVQRFSAEMTMVGLFQLVRRFQPTARAERVSFAYAPPAHRAEYIRIFGGPVLFEQSFTELVFDRRLLDAEGFHADNDVHEALHTLAEQRLLRLTQRTPYASRVREYLIREGWRMQADMKAVARALGLSVRSLRRRLAAEGACYGDIASGALASVAKHLLREKQRSIQETAFELGFSDASAFHRAFKRWTGTTPSAYRDGSTAP